MSLYFFFSFCLLMYISLLYSKFLKFLKTVISLILFCVLHWLLVPINYVTCYLNSIWKYAQTYLTQNNHGGFLYSRSDFQLICIRIIIDIRIYTFPFHSILQNILAESVRNLRKNGF